MSRNYAASEGARVPTGGHGTDRRFRVALLSILLLSAAVRLPSVMRGLEAGAPLLQWRETDVTAIARNFQREGTNILYPRIDWRGDGPGFVEMEFPIISWLIAVIRGMVGDLVQVGRVLSLCNALLTVIVFALLARALLPSAGALAATAFLAFNPLFVQISTAILPEPLMLLGAVLCVFAFWRWLSSDAWAWFAIAGVAGALAILAKAPAVHLGLVLLPLLIWQRGWRGLLDVRPWAMATMIVTPGILWYAHAHRFWLAYGNSIGISNEAHWTGLEVLRRPDLLFGLVRAELVHVWRGGAALIGLFALVAAWREPATRFALAWLVATSVYLAAVARTTSQPWAFYYHIVAVPPAALLVGSGVSAALDLRPGRRTPAYVALVMAAGGAAAAGVWLLFGSRAALVGAAAGVSGALVGGLWWAYESRRGVKPARAGTPGWKTVAGQLDCIGLIGAVALTAGWVAIAIASVLPATPPNELYACSQRFAPLVRESALLLSSSYSCFDPDGSPQATNMPFFFYWMDRKGFNICQEAQSIASVEEFVGRGAEFFAIDRLSLELEPSFGEALDRRFERLSDCRGSRLYDLR